MEVDTPLGTPCRARHRWRKALWFVASLPVLLALLGYLFLSSPWSSLWVAAKIQSLTNMDTRVSGISFTPWNGIEINGLEILQPPPLRNLVKEPLVRIKSVHLMPVWRAWLRGRTDLQSISLDSPRLTVSVELLAELARSAVASRPPPAQLPPLVAAATPPAAIPPMIAAVPSPAPNSPPSPAPPALPSVPRPKPPSMPTFWLHLKNASFTLLKASSHSSLLDISQLSGSIPLAGDSADTTVKIQEISAMGAVMNQNLTAQLNWTSPALALKPLDTEIHHYKVKLASVIVLQPGFPVQFRAQFPNQPLQPIKLPYGAQISSETVTANAAFKGFLLAPGSWYADLITEGFSPKIQIANHQTTFDKASAITLLRGGAISCIDARFTGEDISLLGNATVLANGQAAGAARLVASPETTNAIVDRLFPMLHGAPSLTPLATPQRTAFDVEALGNIRELLVRIGKDGPVAKFKL